MSLGRTLVSLPVVGPVVRTGYRFVMGLGYLQRSVRHLGAWVFRSRETTNFTYHLDPLNRKHLIALVAHATGQPFERIEGYCAELEDDRGLQEHVRRLSLASDQRATTDPEARFGRRVGWYALVRALKPRVVVETGVDKGLGACVLTAALKRNAGEGQRGRYYGTDLNPKAGWLLTGPYAEWGTVLYGDSIASLRTLTDTIDLFINDSDHSAEYEAREYQTVAGNLSPNAVIIGDNAHVTGKLLEFALATGRQFLFFQEKPASHWYPGAGIGLAFGRAERK